MYLAIAHLYIPVQIELLFNKRCNAHSDSVFECMYLTQYQWWWFCIAFKICAYRLVALISVCIDLESLWEEFAIISSKLEQVVAWQDWVI